MDEKNRNNKERILQYEELVDKQKTLINKHSCVVKNIMQGEKLDHINDDGEKTSGDEDVGLEKNDDYSMDGKKYCGEKRIDGGR